MAILRNSSGKIVRAASGKIRRGVAGENCCCGGTYRQARYCSGDNADELANVWMTDADAQTFPGAFSIGSACYYFNFDDPLAPLGGTLYVAADATAFDDCETCDDPCENDIDYSCENLQVTYTRTVEIFLSNTTCTGDPDSTQGPTDVDRTLVLNGAGGAGIIDTCVCETDFWVDDQGELAIQVCCPGGWLLWFTDPFNIDCCPSVRGLTGLSPTAGLGVYPDTVCCQDVGDGSSIRVTYADIEVICADAP